MTAVGIIVIDSLSERFRFTKISSLKEMQAIVGGYIQKGYTLENGDEVIVDEDGLLKVQTSGFIVNGWDRSFVGKGFVIGKPDPLGNYTDVKSTIGELENKIRFITLDGRKL